VTHNPRTATAIFGTILVLTAAILPVSAQAEDPFALVDQYDSGNYGRVVFHDNGLRLERAFVDPGMPSGEQVGINAPVFPGDTLITGEGQRVEIQLAGGSVIRSDGETEATFLSLPDPYAEFTDHTVLQLSQGSIRVSALLAEGEEFRIDTPASSVYLLADGDFRIDVTPGGRTEVISRGGVAEVVGNGGSILLRGGMRTEVFPGTLPEEAWAFNTFVTDNFDRWVDERNFTYGANDEFVAEASYSASAEAYEAMPEEVQPYYGELEHYGDWSYVEEYGHVWSPTLVEAGWSPYQDGYWSDGPGGWFWVSSEPWGWAPYHYGRWNWVASRGWCWSPGRVFAGAWVAWSWGSAHIGWAPLDYWGRPAYVDVAHLGYYDPQVWTFVDYGHVGRRDYQRYAVRVGDVGDDLRTARVVGRAPRVRTDQLARSPESREFAQRLARADRASWLRPVERDRRPVVGLSEVEREMHSRRGAHPPRSRAADPAASASRTVGGRTNRAAAARSTDAFPAYPRQARGRTVSGPSSARGAPSGRPGVVSSRRGTESLRRSIGSRGTDTDQRVRDLYRKIATPGTTGTRTGPTSRTRAQAGRTATTPGNTRSGSPRAGSSRKRPSERQRPEQQRQAPRKRDEGSTPRASRSRPSRTGSATARPRTTAPTRSRAGSARSSGASRTRVSAPSRSRSAGSRSRASAPSRSRTSSAGAKRSGTAPSRRSSGATKSQRGKKR